MLAAGSFAGALTACPEAGGRLELTLGPLGEPASVVALLSGDLLEESCVPASPSLRTTYARTIHCAAFAPESCTAAESGLQPGRWVHRVVAASGGPELQLQARRLLQPDAAAGTVRLQWDVFPLVFTVATLDDFAGCAGCLREAIDRANAAAMPVLIQFAPQLAGRVVLAAPLPALSGTLTTIDAIDFDGVAHRRVIRGNGVNGPGLKITGARNTIVGMAVEDVGVNNDSVLVEGEGADGNLLDSLRVVGRALEPCGKDGCMVDGACRTPITDPPSGACGDDGIAVRGRAGANEPNVVRNCEVSGAFDKGVKVSDGAVARLEHSRVFSNRDGGAQATLTGRLVARENWIEANRGTNSASGIAANGAGATLETRGNISRGNALRGISVRSAGGVVLADDFVCGNGGGPSAGSGVAVFDNDDAPAGASARGLAVVHNAGGGVSVSGTSSIDLGTEEQRGQNALAHNGPGSGGPNFRSLSPAATFAAGNHWQHCGAGWRCDEAAVAARDIERSAISGPFAISPAEPSIRRAPPRIEAAVPAVAAAGEIVRIYGSGFDAIDGTARGCAEVPDANGCHPLRGNCVLFGNESAEVVAVTPTMLVVRAPSSCVVPRLVTVRTRHSRGYGRFETCRIEPEGE